MQAKQAGDTRMQMAHVREMMGDLVAHLKEDEGKLYDPEARALIGTSQEVLKSLMTAYDRYVENSDQAVDR